MSNQTRLKKMGLGAFVIIDGVKVHEMEEGRPWPVFIEVHVANFGSYDFIRAATNSFLLMKQLGWQPVEADAEKCGRMHILYVNAVRKEES